MNADKNVQEFVTTKILTKDQLPEVGEKVIVLDEYGDIDDVAWIVEYPDGTKKWTDGEMDYSIDLFKSWMPRPKRKIITLKDFGPEVEQNFKKKSYYTFNEGLQILFINEKEFLQMKVRGKARFILCGDSGCFVLFDEHCIRHFFDDAEADELVAEIKSRAYERWLLAKESVEKTSSLLGW